MSASGEHDVRVEQENIEATLNKEIDTYYDDQLVDIPDADNVSVFYCERKYLNTAVMYNQLRFTNYIGSCKL